MNRCFYIAIIIFGQILNNPLQAQNLVPNPSFELVSTCNVSTLQQGLNAVSDWTTYDYNDNSPDIYNTCFNPPFNPPNTLAGNSMPYLGNTMAGVAQYPSTDLTEVISVQLNQNLIKDSAYCVSFYAKNAFYQDVSYWSDNLGTLFSSGIVDHNSIRNQTAQIIPSHTLTENEWIEVSGYFIASGGEDYLNIGFFTENPSFYHPLPAPDDFIYYFLDNVSVIQCNKDSLLNVTFELPNVFTPNGDGDNDLYSIKQQNIKTLEVLVLNRWGDLVMQYDGKTTQWNGKDAKGEEVSDGVYFVKAVAETTFGETLQKQQFVHIFRLTD